MTQKYDKCPTCKKWHTGERFVCDGCGKEFSDEGTKWVISPRWPGDDDEARHACSLACLPIAARKAGFDEGDHAPSLVNFFGPMNLITGAAALSRIAELEALMETADKVAADAAYAKGWKDAKRAADDAVARCDSPTHDDRIERIVACDAIRAVEPREVRG